MVGRGVPWRRVATCGCVLAFLVLLNTDVFVVAGGDASRSADSEVMLPPQEQSPTLAFVERSTVIHRLWRRSKLASLLSNNKRNKKQKKGKKKKGKKKKGKKKKSKRRKGCCRMCPSLFYHLQPAPWLPKVFRPNFNPYERPTMEFLEVDETARTALEEQQQAFERASAAKQQQYPCCDFCKQSYGEGDVHYPDMLKYQAGPYKSPRGTSGLEGTAEENQRTLDHAKLMQAANQYQRDKVLKNAMKTDPHLKNAGKQSKSQKKGKKGKKKKALLEESSWASRKKKKGGRRKGKKKKGKKKKGKKKKSPYLDPNLPCCKLCPLGCPQMWVDDDKGSQKGSKKKSFVETQAWASSTATRADSHARGHLRQRVRYQRKHDRESVVFRATPLAPPSHEQPVPVEHLVPATPMRTPMRMPRGLTKAQELRFQRGWFKKAVKKVKKWFGRRRRRRRRRRTKKGLKHHVKKAVKKVKGWFGRRRRRRRRRRTKRKRRGLRHHVRKAIKKVKKWFSRRRRRKRRRPRRRQRRKRPRRQTGGGFGGALSNVAKHFKRASYCGFACKMAQAGNGFPLPMPKIPSAAEIWKKASSKFRSSLYKIKALSKAQLMALGLGGAALGPWWHSKVGKAIKFVKKKTKKRKPAPRTVGDPPGSSLNHEQRCAPHRLKGCCRICTMAWPWQTPTHIQKEEAKKNGKHVPHQFRWHQSAKASKNGKNSTKNATVPRQEPFPLDKPDAIYAPHLLKNRGKSDEKYRQSPQLYYDMKRRQAVQRNNGLLPPDPTKIDGYHYAGRPPIKGFKKKGKRKKGKKGQKGQNGRKGQSSQRGRQQPQRQRSRGKPKGKGAGKGKATPAPIWRTENNTKSGVVHQYTILKPQGNPISPPPNSGIPKPPALKANQAMDHSVPGAPQADAASASGAGAAATGGDGDGS